MKKSMVLFFVLLFAFSGIATAIGADGNGAAAPAAAPAPALKSVYKVGDVVPPLMGKSLDDKEVDLKTILKSDMNLVVFFNTSCRNCMAELDYLQKMTDEKKTGKTSITAVGVDIAGVASIKRLQERRNFSLALYSDPDFSIPGAFGLSMTPSSVVIDKEGKLIEIHTGYDAEVKEKVAKLFK